MQRQTITVGCKETCEALGIGFPGCCDRCHEDADQWGFDLFEYKLPDGRKARFCCYVQLEINGAKIKLEHS
jgi:hypothetical protein